MTTPEITHKIKKLIIDVLDLDIPIEALEANNLIEQYGLNSVDALELLMNIETEFDIEIDEEDLTAELVNSIDQLVNYVEARATV